MASTLGTVNSPSLYRECQHGKVTGKEEHQTIKYLKGVRDPPLTEGWTG